MNIKVLFFFPFFFAKLLEKTLNISENAFFHLCFNGDFVKISRKINKIRKIFRTTILQRLGGFSERIVLHSALRLKGRHDHI